MIKNQSPMTNGQGSRAFDAKPWTLNLEPYIDVSGD
jgi:hypothetical protein